MSYSVLFVDDEPNVLAGLQRAVRSQQWHVLVAGSADEAAVLLGEQTVDVIVCDEQMPGTSGTELLAAAAEQYPQMARILLTGNPSLTTAMRAINQGQVYKYLLKPCDDARLIWTIRDAIERRDSQPATESAATPHAKGDSLMERVRLFRRLRAQDDVENASNPRLKRGWDETPLFADAETADGEPVPHFGDESRPSE